MIEAGTYIIDKSVINSLLGDEQVQINRSTLFFEYLKFNEKRAILTPKAYKEIYSKIEKNPVLSRYFKIFIINGESIIGYSEEETEEQELLLLAENIPVKQIFIVSEPSFNKEFWKQTNERTLVFNLEKIFGRIWSQLNFRDWVSVYYHKKLEYEVGNDHVKKVLGFIGENLDN